MIQPISPLFEGQTVDMIRNKILLKITKKIEYTNVHTTIIRKTTRSPWKPMK